MSKQLTQFEKEKELLKEIVAFNSLVAEQKKIINYRTLQLEQNIDDEEKDKKFKTKLDELTQMIQIARSGIEIKYNIKINNESEIYGILPEMFLTYELNYFLNESKKAKYHKITEKCIQEKIDILNY